MSKIEELKQKKIGIIYGGTSSEREVSLRSGKNVNDALISKGYKTVLIDMDENIVENIKKQEIEFAYIILHGSPGEDGTIQGLLELMKIPYTGSGVLGSAIALNKIVSKQLFVANKIPTPPFLIINNVMGVPQNVEFGFPLIFKPCSEGSSVGVVKIDSEEQMKKELPKLMKKYEYGIIEKYLKGIDITIGVLDDNKEVKALPVLELCPHNEFYDYEAKYTEGKTDFIIPARIDDELTQKVQQLAVQAHKVLWCKGVSRVDMLVVNRDIYVLEVNTLPGMTGTSDLPAEAKEIGMKFADLVEKILLSGYMQNE